MKYWGIPLAILAALSASVAFADEFKTVNGKEYKNVTISRVEADGIVLKSKSGISKVYFTELPKEVQQRFHYSPAQAATAHPQREQIALPAKQESAWQAAERRRQQDAKLATENFNGFIATLFGPILMIAVFVIAIIVIVAVVRAKARRQKRALLLKQVHEFTATVAQNRALPLAPTDIMLKPGESAFYSSPSVLYETRAVREYQAAHTGVRVAKGVYVGGTRGRSLSTQQWARLDTGRLTITNKRLVFVGSKEERAIALDKVVSVNPDLTAIVVSAEGRQKAMAFEVANSLIVTLIIRLASKVTDPSNLSGDKINIPSLG